MNQAQWERIKALYPRVVSEPDSCRIEAIHSLAAGDPQVASELVRMIRAQAKGDSQAPHVLRVLDRPDDPSRRATRPEEDDELGTTVLGRYRLDARLGSGSFGTVYRARDTLTGNEVALKTINEAAARSPRIRREVMALRLLRMPGVVHILDEGQVDRASVIVTELITGRPFPGDAAPVAWDSIRGTVLGILDTLGRIHRAGVVHRDLKPENVLVDEAGSATLLDLGMSGGPGLGLRVTQAGALVGTPSYMAPEQFHGRSERRSDLYALGVMLYEALSGRPPHPANDIHELIERRLNEQIVPLESLVPELPGHVAELVRMLLEVDPRSRPSSAEEAYRRLSTEIESAPAERLPWLGDRAVLSWVTAELRAGRSADIHGEPGSGRSRALREIGETFARDGRRTFWTMPGRRPFASLEPVVGEIGSDVDDDLEAVRDRLRDTLVQRLAGGAVLLVDDVHDLDRWSRTLVDDVFESGGIVRAWRGAPHGTGGLYPLSAHDLRALIVGVDRIFHTREDAAQELWARTGGAPARVVAELEAWQRAGLVTRVADRFEMGDQALERLRAGLQDRLGSLPTGAGRGSLDARQRELLAYVQFAWPHADRGSLLKLSDRPRWQVEADLDELAQLGAVRTLDDGRFQALDWNDASLDWTEEERTRAHGVLADALAPGTHERFFHLIGADRPDEACAEARISSRQLLEAGEERTAEAILIEALNVARAGGVTATETALLGDLTCAAVRVGTTHTIDHALYALGRALTAPSELQGLEALLQALRTALDGSWERGLELASTLPPFGDPRLEWARYRARIAAARRGSIEQERQIVVESAAWSAASGDPEAQAAHSGWMGWLCYREGDYRQAAGYHDLAATQAPSEMLRAQALLHAASALLEAFELDAAEQRASDSLSILRARRAPHQEARAEWIQRAAAYRRGDCLVPDLELTEAARHLGVPNLEGLILLNEAAVAWRAGDPGVVHELCERAIARWRTTGRNDLCDVPRALAIAAGSPIQPGELDELTRGARDQHVPSYGIQVMGLLAAAFPARREELYTAASEVARSIPEDSWGGRLEVISIHEATGAVSLEAVVPPPKDTTS